MVRRQRGLSEKIRHAPAPWNPSKGRSSKKRKAPSKSERVWNW
jgi:hypothetical protein